MTKTLLFSACLILATQALAADPATSTAPDATDAKHTLVMSATISRDPPATRFSTSTAEPLPTGDTFPLPVVTKPPVALKPALPAKTVQLPATAPVKAPAAATTTAAPAVVTATAPATSSPTATLAAPASPAPQPDTADADEPTPHIISVQDEPQSDLWQRIRDGLELPEADNATVHSYERLYTSHPASMSATLDRAKLYLFHIVEEVDKRHMPMEVALLPIVESSFNPQALSPSAASGIWQFLPSTGRVFGLKQNNWYDGRRDILTATRAALDYLERLHTMFGDWPLALAAYNCGEGCIARAMAQNRSKGLPTDLDSLSLPAQTRNYVPKLIAVRNIIRDPGQYGVDLGDIPNQPSFKKVTLQYPVEAKTAAKLAEMNMDDFLALNPGFRRRVIYAESQNTLLLPPDKAEAFRRNLADTEAKNIRLHTFDAPKGALLSRIADHFNVTVQWLTDHNPLATKRGKLVAAQTLVLPPAARKVADATPAQLIPPPETKKHGHDTKASSKDKKLAKASAKDKKLAKKTQDKVRVAKARNTKMLVAKRSHYRIHTVRKGDTFTSLAKRYKVNVADIVELNGAHKTLRPGERIQIPEKG